MNGIIKAIDRLSYALAALACVAVVAMMIHVSIEVTMRSLFNITLPGTIIFVSNYYMVAAVCLPLALIERLDAQISVDVLTELLPQGPRTHLFAFTLLISILVFGIVAWSTWQEALAQMRLDKFMVENGIRFTTWFGYFAVPFGYGMAALWMVLKFLRYLAGKGVGPIGEPKKDIEQVLHD